MSNFTPTKGLLFYVFYKPRERVVAGEIFGPEKIIKQVDGSYRGQVFKCVATDDTYIVGQPVFGGYSSHGDKPYMFARCDVDFAPVGPDVLAVLDINDI
jgi:hypothetical protein